MTDLSHEMGADLQLSATGDLLGTSGADYTRQRVLRRLLTNPGDYIFPAAWGLPSYGAGLARFVGSVAAAPRITAVIARQMKMERGVGLTPAPVVQVTADQLGTVVANVSYADQDGSTTTMAVNP